ncbi:MAG: methylaspartate mutase subunit S [Enterobacteriaceae bacterium]
MQKPTIVFGVIGADCHAVGNKILERIFQMQNFNAINLGVMVSQDEYIDAAIETGAQAIVVSSIYGHGEVDCIGMRERCIERGIGEILLYVGGNLVIGKHDFSDIEAKFKKMGFNRVFSPDTDLEYACTLIRGDIVAMTEAERTTKELQ